jgi:hypothetical protein
MSVNHQRDRQTALARHCPSEYSLTLLGPDAHALIAPFCPTRGVLSKRTKSTAMHTGGSRHASALDCLVNGRRSCRHGASSRPALPSASLSSRFATRYKPSYCWERVCMTAPADRSLNGLSVSMCSASATGRFSSPPPQAMTCVTWVSMMAASRVCCSIHDSVQAS